MYGLVRQTFPPTTTSHCLSCNLIDDNEKNLVVAGSTVLTVYRLRKVRSSHTTPGVPEKRKKKLDVVFRQDLNGILHSVQSARLEHKTRDSLLLSFENAKFSMIEYDPATHCLKTVKLVDFKEEVDKIVSFSQTKSLIRIDPQHRCGAMLVFGTALAVFPFKRELLVDDQDWTKQAVDDVPHYIIEMKSISERIANIVDIQFLHGYHEPTLLILFESLRTWPGRVAVRQDTCALIAISMNIVQKVHPVIWSLNNLPFDSFKALAVPKPIGGVVIMAVNSLLYLNQSIPPCGASLNSITESSTMFQLKPQPGVCVSLDCASAAFISNDRMVLSLKGGEIYVVTLVADSMRTVRSFNFDKAAASVITSCICLADENYLFLGSHLGNSVLLRYTEKREDDLPPPVDTPEEQEEESSPKRKRAESTAEQPAKSVLDELDELEVYGTDTHSGTELTSYSFEVADSLPNTAPFSKVVIGEPAFLSEEFLSESYLDLEVIGCSGYGKNGALTVLQRSIRPQVVTAFELPGCVNMWTVKSPESEGSEGDCTLSQHSFLILSRGDSSMVLQTGQEIMELDHCGFNTQSATICVGNLVGDRYILQVCPNGIYLLEEADQLEHLPLETAAVSCFIADPYAVILLSDGSLCLLTVREEADHSLDSVELSDLPSVRLHLSKPDLPKGPPIVACCLYEDLSGLFKLESDVVVKQEPPSLPARVEPVQEPTPLISVITVDEEDELLYGESAPEVLFPGIAKAEPSSQQSVSAEPTSALQSPPDVTEDVVESSYWCVACRENGDLEIYELPAFNQVMKVEKFVFGDYVLKDRNSTGQHHGSDDRIVLHEVLLIGMGLDKRRPHLMARVDQDILIYEAFLCQETLSHGRLKIRFRKIPHGFLQRERPSGPQERPSQIASKLRYFENVSGYSGVFVCGAFPHWIFMTNRGSLRFHPMSIDGPIASFASFNNVNCPDGFLYFNQAEELRVCVLPTHLSYDSPWPIRKIPLRASPRFISYHPESMTYAVVTSKEVENQALPRLNNDDIEEVEYMKREERFIFPTMDQFTLQLYSSLNWEAVPNAEFLLDGWEHVTALKTLRLHSEETISGRKGFLVMSTTSVFGEEVTSRGRIVIFDVIEVVPEPGKPLTKHKLKELCSKEQRGPVTAVEQVDGYLLSSIGQKIYVWKFKGNNDIVGLAFIDTQLCIHTAVTLKNFVLIADITKSLSLLRYQEEHKTLALVSKDFRELEIYTAEYVVDGRQLAFLVSDADRNLILYHYHPEAVESVGGQRLLRRADFHLGSHVNCMFRTPLGPAKGSSDKKTRQITWFGTLDGGLGYFIPMPEKTYRRLLMLQNKLVTGIPHFAGLNPKEFRLLRTKQKFLDNPHKNVLDGNLLWRYINLSYRERNEFARQIGTTVNQILQDLMDVEKGTTLF
eukprot:m.136215 g.136215  ORF g.136215 m.136215 type:complete len:1413 (+) comp38172_c1_seq126:32-4270(+)